MTKKLSNLSRPVQRVLINITVIACVFTMLSTGTSLAAPTNQFIFEDFELINSDDFIIGTENVSAHFSNGFSAVAGISELYNSGNHAWMVNPGDTGRIEFQPNAAVVEFFARTRSTANGTSTLTAFDDQGVQVGDSITLNPGDRFELFSFKGSIGSIEYTNNADSSCSNCMNTIDDFGFTPEIITPSEDPITLPISVNQTSFSTADTLRLDIATSNPGLTSRVDIYSVILFPDRNTLANFTDLDATLVIGRLNALADLEPMIKNLSLTSTFSVSLSGFFTYQWTGGEPVGGYTAYLVMVPAGALADGVINQNDIIQIDSADFTFKP